MTVVCDPVNGTVIVYGATSGGVPDTVGAWNTFIPSTSELRWGSDNSGGNQIDSFISNAFSVVTNSEPVLSIPDTIDILDDVTAAIS
jgi:hypothetical protein